MSQYPNAYCVKCGHHTKTEQKHTVVLQSNARALHGKCPECGSDVFKFLKKKTQVKSKAPVSKGKMATVTSLHDVRERRSPSGMSDLENKVLAMQEKQPIDYVLMFLGFVAAGCLIYLLYR